MSNKFILDGQDSGNVLPVDPKNAGSIDGVTPAPTDNFSSSGLSTIDTNKILGDAIGNQFANTMAGEGFHPVLIFGAPKSGKTSFLLSLIRYMFVGHDCDSQIRLCLDNFPNESGSVKPELKEQDRETWVTVKKYANDLFNKYATEFLQSNQLALATQVKFPFFVPIEITPKKPGLKPLKIAFLEGEGEWYSLNDKDSEIGPHKEFKHEITAFLERYPHQITAIFVAPHALEGYDSNQDGKSSNSAQQVKDRDFALYGIIDQFEKARTNQIGADNYLYLLTKWDIRCGSVSHPEFIYKDHSVVRAEILNKFPISLNRFSNIREIESVKTKSKLLIKSKKTVSAYCAGVLKYAVLSLPEESARLVNHYARKIWDYLYFNATNRHLYSEFEPVKLGLIERVIRWLKR